MLTLKLRASWPHFLSLLKVYATNATIPIMSGTNATIPIMSGNTEGKVAEEQQPIEVAESLAEANGTDSVTNQTTTSTGGEQTFSRTQLEMEDLVSEVCCGIAKGKEAYAYSKQSATEAPLTSQLNMCQEALGCINIIFVRMKRAEIARGGQFMVKLFEEMKK